MIYPTLHLTPNETIVAYIDTNFDQNPFLSTSFASQEEGITLWMDTISAFVMQYWNGYDDGYLDGMEEMSDEDEQGDILWM